MVIVSGKVRWQQRATPDTEKTRKRLKKTLYCLPLFFLLMTFSYAKVMVVDKTAKPIVAVSLAGLWESNIGWKYNIKQQGNKFTWTVINRDQKASGTINSKNDIEVSWSDTDSKGTSVGSILEIDPQGRAIFIEWDNGVFFQRIRTGADK